MAPFDFGGFSHQFTPASFIVKLNTDRVLVSVADNQGLRKECIKTWFH